MMRRRDRVGNTGLRLARRGAILILLLAAWALLLFRLDEVPPGFQHDQTFSVRDALYVLGGHYPIYFPANFGRDPLFMYSAAGAISLAGGHLVWSLRFTSATWALLGLAASYPLARRYLPAAAALLAVALMEASFWFLLAGRLGLEPIALLPLAAAMLYFLHRGLARHAWRDFAFAGILGGIANYTYLASRTLYALPLILALYLMVRGLWLRHAARPGTSPIAWRPVLADMARLGLAFGLMLATSAPLLLYLRTHPGGDGRVGELNHALLAALAGDPRQLLANTADTVRSILWLGSSSLPYHYALPGRPVLGPAWALTLLIGLAITARRLGRPGGFLLLLALGLGLGSDFLTGADALYMRAVYALPLLFILAVAGLWALGHLLCSRLPSPYLHYARGASVALIAGLLLWHAADNARAYFVTWPQAERTQRIYNGDFRLAARYMDRQAQADAVFLGTDRDLALDSETYRYYEPRRLDARFFLLPDTPPLPAAGSALYLLPGGAPMPPGLAALAGIQRDRQVLADPAGRYDLLQAFRLESADVQATLASWGVAAPARSLLFGGCLQLEGASFRDLGDHGELITWWALVRPCGRTARPGYPLPRLKISAAVTDRSGYKWAQSDGATSLPLEGWQAGDHLLEITQVPLPADLPPDRYAVRLALYDDENGPLPPAVNSKAVARAPVVAEADLALRPAGVAPRLPHQLAAAKDALLAPLNASAAPGRLFAGAEAPVHISWQPADSLDTSGLSFVVRARSAAGTWLWQQDDSLAAPLPALWPRHHTIRLAHRLSPPPGAPRGDVAVEICAVRHGVDVLGCASIGEVSVHNHVGVTTLPRVPERASGANWGGYLALAGYDVEDAGHVISLTLYWRVESRVPVALRRFVHAVDRDGTMVGQSDDDLNNEDVPVQLWQTGEYLVDRVTLPIRGGQVEPRLHVGLYDPDTGERVPVVAADGSDDPDRQIDLPIR